jgi:hypothetical protein
MVTIPAETRGLAADEPAHHARRFRSQHRHHALFIYDQRHQFDPADDTIERALNASMDSETHVSSLDNIVVFSTPVQFNYATPMRIEVWPTEPPGDADNWDQVVDVDLDVPTGQLVFRENGPTDDPILHTIAPNSYPGVAGMGEAARLVPLGQSGNLPVVISITSTL